MINYNKKIKYRGWNIIYLLENHNNILNQKAIYIEYIAKKDDGILIERGLMYRKNNILENLKNKIDLFEDYS